MGFGVHQFFEASDGTWLFAGGDGQQVCLFMRPAGTMALRLLLQIKPVMHVRKDHHCTRLDVHLDEQVIVIVCEHSGEGTSKGGQVRVLREDELVYSYDGTAAHPVFHPCLRLWDAFYDGVQGSLWLLSVGNHEIRRIILRGEYHEAVAASPEVTTMLDLKPDYVLLGLSFGRFQCISKSSMEMMCAFALPEAGFHPPTQLLSVPRQTFICVGAIADESNDDREDRLSAVHGHILWMERDQTDVFFMRWRHDIPEYMPSVRSRLAWLTCWERDGHAWVAYLGGETEIALRVLDANGKIQCFPLRRGRFQPLGIQVSNRSGQVIIIDGLRLRFFRVGG